MEDLASLEEFKAERCWELQRIEGLNRRERLNYLHISTDNTDFWKDMSEFLRSPTHQEPSTAIFSGRADNDKIFDKGDMLRIAEQFNLQTRGIVSRKFTKFTDRHPYKLLAKLDAHSALLICFITNDAKSQQFNVRFQPSWYGPCLEYSSMSGDRGGRGVHVFMWTKGSRLFKEYSEYSEIFVSLFHQDSEGCSSTTSEGCSSSRSNVEERGRGWIIMVDKELDVSKVYREFFKT